ncbi:hypothetical protein JTB14_027922 [Gonioctena quinquepunctata]|nr:hypothetical protein JTB14_027922 [Gonioctena quinquepunctata]
MLLQVNPKQDVDLEIPYWLVEFADLLGGNDSFVKWKIKFAESGEQDEPMEACLSEYRSDMRQVREVSQQETRPADEDDQLFVCSVVKVGEVKKDNSSVWMETVKLNGREINCKVDTGSEVNIIPRQVYNQLTMGKLTKSSIVLKAYGGAKLNPIGIVKLNCRIEDKSLEFDFLVLDLNVKPIIGLPSCYDLGFIKKTSSIESIKNREQFIKENQDVFEGLGSFPEECNISLKKGSIPIARPCRRVPLVIKERLQAKLKSLDKQKIMPLSGLIH